MYRYVYVHMCTTQVKKRVKKRLKKEREGGDSNPNP